MSVIANKSIKKNMVLNIIREVLSFLFPLLTTVYVVRAIGKENYGLVQYVRSVISYFALIAGLGIGTYAVREGAQKRENKREFTIFANEILTTNLLSTLFSILLLFFSLFFFRPRDNIDLRLYIIFSIPIVVSTVGRDWITTVYEDFVYTTIRYIIISIISLALIYLLVHNENDYIVYSLILMLSSCSYGIINFFYVKKYTDFRICKPNNCKKHIKPILILFCGTIASTIYLNSDITLLGAIVNNEAVAVYSIAANIYGAVKQISNTVVTVVIPRLSFYVGVNDKKSSDVLVNKICDCVFMVLIPSVVGLIALGKEALIFMGGIEYIEGLPALYVLSGALFFAVFANVFVRCVLIPYQQDQEYLKATIISAFVNVLLNFIFIPWLSFTGAAITTFISEFIICAYVYEKSKTYQKIKIEPLSVFSSSIGCLAIITICLLSKKLLSNAYTILISAGILSIIVYYFIICLLKHPLAQDINKAIWNNIKKYIKKEAK